MSTLPRRLQKGSKPATGGRKRAASSQAKATPSAKRQQCGCRTCGEVKGPEHHSANNADCKSCASAVYNMRQVAIAQKQVEWYDEEAKDPERRCNMVNNYHLRCPAKESGGHRNKFPISDYKRQVLV